MERYFRKFLFGIVFSALGGIMLNPGSAAAISGACASCHVMHASQTGTTSTPRDYLLKSDCLGCHTGDNTGSNSTPYVYATSAADITASLAGGNFKFADIGTGNERYGHNPVELSGGVDTTLTTPPGWKTGFTDSDGGQVGGGSPAWASNDLSCAGTYGCHGTHDASGVTGAHHANTTGAATGSTLGASFRFLNGIKGYEEGGYDFNPLNTASTYNVYYGEERTAETATDKATMSYFCAECHGIFHSGSGNEGILDTGTFLTSPWIRHPVDISMPQGSTEYNGYNTYSPVAPVASSDVADGTINVSASTDRIVMCLSCHFGHAGPYASDLRWDPAAGVKDAGCKVCHTTK